MISLLHLILITITIINIIMAKMMIQEELEKTSKDRLHCVPITHDSLRLVDQVAIIILIIINNIIITIVITIVTLVGWASFSKKRSLLDKPSN